MNRHPAHLMPFADLRAALQSEREAGRVFVRTDGPLELYGYTAACQYGGEWNEINLMARGIILDTEVSRIAATSFPKFFNLGERLRMGELPAEPFAVTEKMDGSDFEGLVLLPRTPFAEPPGSTARAPRRAASMGRSTRCRRAAIGSG